MSNKTSTFAQPTDVDESVTPTAANPLGRRTKLPIVPQRYFVPTEAEYALVKDAEQPVHSSIQSFFSFMGKHKCIAIAKSILERLTANSAVEAITDVYSIMNSSRGLRAVFYGSLPDPEDPKSWLTEIKYMGTVDEALSRSLPDGLVVTVWTALSGGRPSSALMNGLGDNGGLASTEGANER